MTNFATSHVIDAGSGRYRAVVSLVDEHGFDREIRCISTHLDHDTALAEAEKIALSINEFITVFLDANNFEIAPLEDGFDAAIQNAVVEDFD